MMTTLDWVIVVVPMLVVLAVGWHCRRYVRGVADFLAAGRCGGRYLMLMSLTMAGTAVISIVAQWEALAKAGVTYFWWNQLTTPIFVMLALFGFFIYRFRQTRALTLAQFYELRFSRRFRVFMGVTAVIGGVLNFAIYPAVTGRFFCAFLRLPATVSVGPFEVSSYALVMLAGLALALVLVVPGGQVQILATNGVQALFAGVAMVALLFGIWWVVSPEQMWLATQTAPPGESFINPFDTGRTKDFNIWLVLMSSIYWVYAMNSWQQNSGSNASALNAHEGKMSWVIAPWRNLLFPLIMVVLGAAALAYLRLPEFAAGAGQVEQILQTIDNPQIRDQMRLPVAIGEMLPVGLKGTFVLFLIFLMVTTDTATMHSWGTIFVQDVILPLKRRAFTPRGQLWALRVAIIVVAAFAFVFSLYYKQTDYLWMFMNITGAIFLGGAGCATLGGLYWSRATTAGAWAGMITGSTVAVSGVVLPPMWPNVAKWLLERWPDWTWVAAHAEKFPLHGIQMAFIAMLLAIAVFVVVSFLTCREPFDMDRLLHRGKYALASEGVVDASVTTWRDSLRNWRTVVVGIDEHFTRGDRRWAWATFAFTWFWFGVFAVVAVWNAMAWAAAKSGVAGGLPTWPDSWWWRLHVLFYGSQLIILPPLTVLFSWGAIRDIVRMFRLLRERVPDPRDDGRVVDHRLLTDAQNNSRADETPKS